MRVFEPIQIGNVIIPNRIFRAAHGTFLARGGITDAFIDYHLASAKGGCGLTVLETASVHRTGDRQRAVGELYDELRDAFEGSIQLIGDARSPRDLQAAIAEGRRAALALDQYAFRSNR